MHNFQDIFQATPKFILLIMQCVKYHTTCYKNIKNIYETQKMCSKWIYLNEYRKTFINFCSTLSDWVSTHESTFLCDGAK